MSLTLAFIGLKGHQFMMLDAIPAIPGIEILAVADDNAEALKRVPEFPGATPKTKTYLDYRELLANHKPDIVVEAGADGDRVDVITACAERGFHFICEKPLAMDLPGLDRVRRAISDSGVHCTMLLTMRLEPPYIALRQALRSGLVGEVTQAGGQKSYRLGVRPAWQKSHTTFSGILPFIGIHLVDLVRWTTGREFTEVMAYASNLGHPEMGDMEDNGCLLARLDNGASAALRLDFCRPAAAPTHGDDRLRIAGNRGVIEARDGAVTTITQTTGPRELRLPAPVDLLADFVKTVQKGTPPYIPFADCVRATEIVLRAKESAQTGRPMPIPPS
jgi:predicted dehydrogenase